MTTKKERDLGPSADIKTIQDLIDKIDWNKIREQKERWLKGLSRESEPETEQKIFTYAGREVPSMKNSKRICRGRLISSQATLDYFDWILPQLEADKQELDLLISQQPEGPLQIHFWFHRGSRRRFDYINIAQIISDALVKAGVIEDDDAAHYVPVFEGYDIVDKERAGFSFWIC